MAKTKSNINVEVEDLSSVSKKVTVVIPAAEVDKEIKAAYSSLKATANIAGFRKGAVPLSVLKARFADNIAEDVTSRLVEGSFPHALGEKGLRPLAAPQVDVVTPRAEEGKDFSYILTFDINPEVDVQGYKGMEIKEEKIEVTEKDVDEGLKRLREAKGEYKEVDREIREGDLVTVDYEAFLDGKLIKRSKTQDYPMIIGQVTPLPGMDEALKGAVKAQTVEKNITFPENYSEEGLGGKEALFKITVKVVKERVLPKLDDEFAKDLDFETLDQLKAKVREDLTEVKTRNEKERQKTAILTELIEKHEFEVPETLLKKYLGMILGRVLDNMRSGIVAPEDRGLDIDKLKEKYTPTAVRQVKEDIILDNISAQEKIELTQQEVDDAIRHLAATRNVSYETLLARIEREGAIDVIRDGLKHEKAFDIIFASKKTAAS